MTIEAVLAPSTVGLGRPGVEPSERRRTQRTSYEPHRSSLLSPRRIRDLSRPRPWRAAIDSLACWVGILAAWILVAQWPRWWAVLLALSVIGTRYHRLFIIGHDGLHRRLFPIRAHNDLFNDLVVLGPIGAITRINRVNHIEHHDYLATSRDPDRHRHACFNKAERLALFGFLTGLTSVWRSMRNVFVNKSARARSVRADDQTRSYRPRDLVILIGWQILLVAGLTVSIGWWAYPVLWLAPVFLFVVLGDNLRSFLEHSHPEADDAADRHRLITFISNPFERALLAPMNMNCHAVHHLWPSIPYYNLPEADREVRSQSGAAGLVWRRSYFAYLWRYFRALPLEECKDPMRLPPPLVDDELRQAPHIPDEALPACPLCGAASFTPLASGFDYEMLTCSNAWRFVRCHACEHVWLNPRPAISALPVIYPTDYYAYNYQQISALALKGKAFLDRLKMRWIRRHRRAATRTYLDIGCGDGRYLRAIERLGVPRDQLFGLEVDPRSVEALAAQGYRAVCERVEDCHHLPEGGMDLITMFHVIEHVDDPRRTVEQIVRWLAPEGILAIETPNLDSLDARLFRRGLWGGFHFPRHWNLFTAKSLTDLLADCGLEVLAVRYQTGHSFWMYSFHHALRFGRRRFPRLARAFDPLRSLPFLMLFTAFDIVRAALRFRTSAVLVVARRPPSQ
jgi:fatty acid desaturase/SAM-dependent methyltransferase